MKKTNNKKLKRDTKAKKLNWYSFGQVFGRSAKSKGFKKGYNEEMSRIRLAKQLREIRKRRNLTQKVVAQRAAMPQSVIARIESGEHGVSLDTLNKVANALGKRVELV